jgi:hypothetical protein
MEERKMTREEWREADFKERLAHAINCCSRENGSMTPDYILGDFLYDVLAAFDKAHRARERWYEQDTKGDTAVYIDECLDLTHCMIDKLKSATKLDSEQTQE